MRCFWNFEVISTAGPFNFWSFVSCGRYIQCCRQYYAFDVSRRCHECEAVFVHRTSELEDFFTSTTDVISRNDQVNTFLESTIILAVCSNEFNWFDSDNFSTYSTCSFNYDFFCSSVIFFFAFSNVNVFNQQFSYFGRTGNVSYSFISSTQ